MSVRRFMESLLLLRTCLGTLNLHPVVVSLSSTGGEGRGEEAIWDLVIGAFWGFGASPVGSWKAAFPFAHALGP
jgi:hypothetical protein